MFGHKGTLILCRGPEAERDTAKYWDRGRDSWCERFNHELVCNDHVHSLQLVRHIECAPTPAVPQLRSGGPLRADDSAAQDLACADFPGR
jgi:hypothetical protein